jgi:hypothetical protein
MSNLPPSLQEFGHRLKEAAEIQIEKEREENSQQRGQDRSRRLRRGTLLGALAAILLPAGVIAGATTVLSEDGIPLLGESDLPSDVRPAVDPGIRLESAVSDPAGGLPWALRVFTNQQGQECATVGRLRGGVLGQLRDTEFRPFPEGVPGVCGSLAEEGLLVGVERRGQPQPRTVVYGLTSGRDAVSVTTGGDTLQVEPGSLGSYIIVLEGVQQLRGATVRTTLDGQVRERALG